jgi:hypothetical protein
MIRISTDEQRMTRMDADATVSIRACVTRAEGESGFFLIMADPRIRGCVVHFRKFEFVAPGALHGHGAISVIGSLRAAANNVGATW